MSRWLQVSLGVALLSVVSVSLASAGLNPTATARIYWQTGSTGVGQATRNSTAGVPQLVVTVKNVTSFRGADVQLLLGALDKVSPVPDAWNFTTGACADGAATFYLGSRGGAYPNIISSAPAVAGIVATQNGEYVAVDDCVTPHNTALFWMSAAGAAGQTRNAAIEYGVWAIKFDVSTTLCPGSIGNNEVGVCIAPNYRQPCTAPSQIDKLAIVDANAAKDFAPFDAGFNYLTWFNSAGGTECPNAVPVQAKTWGQIRRIFK